MVSNSVKVDEGYDQAAWKKFYKQEQSDRGRYFMPEMPRPFGPKIYSAIFPHQFKRNLQFDMYELASAIRKIQNDRKRALWLKSLLPHRKLMEYFEQPSTRTWASTFAGADDLGMSIADIRDVRTSSMAKDEHDLDSVRTLIELFDALAMRHHVEDKVEQVAWHLSRCRNRDPDPERQQQFGVINCGSGPDLHVTQGLLNAYTVKNKLGTVDGLTMLMAGDLRTSRTMRTDAYMAREFDGTVLLFCAPPEFQMKPDILAFLDKHHVRYEVHHDMVPHLSRANVVSVCRMQDEYRAKLDPGELRCMELAGEMQEILKYYRDDMEQVRPPGMSDLNRIMDEVKKHIEGKQKEAAPPKHLAEFSITPDTIKHVKDDAIIMHPLPRRDELSWRCDDDPRVVIWSQVRNGRWIRAALLAMMFGVDDDIRRQYPNLFENWRQPRWQGDWDEVPKAA